MTAVLDSHIYPTNPALVRPSLFPGVVFALDYIWEWVYKGCIEVSHLKLAFSNQY